VLLHLGMSGRLSIAPAGPDPPVAHEHLVMITDAGMRVALVDPRRFGSVDLVPTAAEDQHRLLAGLGPEPAAQLRCRGPIRRSVGQANADQGSVARPAGGRRVGKHLCVRGPVSRRDFPAPAGCERFRDARRAAGAGDQDHIGRSHCRRRFIFARLRAAQR
jgi:hypothetical protein